MISTACAVSRRLCLVVTVLLGLSTAAWQSASAQYVSHDRAPELQHLIEQLVYQLELVKRSDAPQHLDFYEQVREAISRWNRSTRTDADFVEMESWLRQAIQATIPGVAYPLPAPPRFGTMIVRADTTPAPEIEPPGAEQPAETLPDPTQPPRERTVPAERPEEPDSSAASETPTAPPSPDSGQRRDFWSDHPASQPLPQEFRDDNPFQDDEPSGSTEHGELPQIQLLPQPSAVAGTPAPATTPDSQPQPDEVPLNWPELRARIQGYNQGLRQVEGELAEPDRLTPARMADLARLLNELLDRREFIDLYLGTLTATQRGAVPKPADPRSSIRLLAAQILAARNRIDQDQRLAVGGARGEELSLLQDAARQLTNLGIQSWSP